MNYKKDSTEEFYNFDNFLNQTIVQNVLQLYWTILPGLGYNKYDLTFLNFVYVTAQWFYALTLILFVNGIFKFSDS